MFRIKICGITNVEDARAAIYAGADAIGLNFFEKSPRYVTVDQAREICDTIRGSAIRVGVFVNHPPEPVGEVFQTTGIDVCQLHGDESPRLVADIRNAINSDRAIEPQMQELDSVLNRKDASAFDMLEIALKISCRNLIRARRMTDEGVAAIAADLEACRKAGGAPGAVLVDAFTPGRYGGTGETVSWAGLSDHKKWLGDVPLILAGGLTPENVAEAIRIVRPHGVDVASGVESSPGKKDRGKIRAFVEAAHSAF